MEIFWLCLGVLLLGYFGYLIVVDEWQDAWIVFAAGGMAFVLGLVRRFYRRKELKQDS
jgi:uncharacterized membrane protein YjjP (DUF1212 family)